jgi:type III pantothenate kinase
MFGYAGLVDGIVERMKAEAKTKPLVIATGGLARIVAQEAKSIDKIEEMLTLEGLRLIYNLNKKPC